MIDSNENDAIYMVLCIAYYSYTTDNVIDLITGANALQN